MTVSERLRRAWRNVRAAGPRRLSFTMMLLLIALLVSRLSWSVPVLGEAERALYDARVALTAPQSEPDNRLVMIPYKDETLIATGKRSPLDRGLLARALTALDAMGAKAIGVDIFIDQPQPEDAQLVAALRAMKTPTFLSYADLKTNEGNLVYDQQQFLHAFFDKLKGSRAGPASVRFTTDLEDGVARAWPRTPAGLPPLLSVAMSQAGGDVHPGFTAYHGAIAYRQPVRTERSDDSRPLFNSFPIDIFGNLETAPAFADQVRGRYVLIGGDLVDIDQFDTPFTRFSGATVPGLEIHAQMLGQLLDNTLPKPMNSLTIWALALLVVVCGALSGLLELRWAAMTVLIAIQIAIFGGLPWLAQAQGSDTLGVPAAGWAVGWVIAFLGAGSAARAVGADKRRFAQSALGKYLPRDIAQQIIAQPELLSLHGERREIFALFSDLEGFTKLSHAIEPEMVAALLNRYLDELSAEVLRYGGVIDKFVGDAVVAFWGAPIARPDDGANAARAAYAIWQAGEKFRSSIPEGVPPIGRTRVGLHFGEAIVGNFGGEGRIQYTALGDAMNTASRLESANKMLGSNVLASREAVDRSGLDWWRPLGRVVLRGRATPVEIYEAAPDFPAADRARLWEMFAPDLAADKALDRIVDLVTDHPDDPALANLCDRMRSCSNGAAYELS